MGNKTSNIGVTTKLVSLLMVFAVIPLTIVTIAVFISFGDIKNRAGDIFHDNAEVIADKIDRNLFERYGDVQAFALNHVIYDESNWYKGGENPMVETMNNYVSAYGIYTLTVLVDLEGKVIAVNSKDAGGNSIDSSFLYKKDFSGEQWFKSLSAGQFTTRMPHTAPGNDISSGTYIEEINIDDDVTQAYKGSDGLTIGFSTPVYKDGKVIAFWSNHASFSLVEEIVQQQYAFLKDAGFPSTEITLMNSEGKVIMDYDPAKVGNAQVQHDFNTLMKLDLASKGVVAAQKAVDGEAGYMYAEHARKGIVQAAGYTHLRGALGYPGMNWSVMVRVPEDEAAPWLAAIQAQIGIIIAICIAVVMVLGMWIGRKVVGRLTNVVEVAGQAAQGDMTTRLEVGSGDEFGQLATAFNTMLERVSDVVSEVSEGSDVIRSAADEVSRGNADLSQRTEEQASSLEETASSMEEMTSTVKQNADNASQANQLAAGARTQAEKGGEVVGNAVTAMAEINSSSKKIADIISVIDEIAFQTNLLALNAAVEAARAGEQGRGFAVVAGEVRSLAGRSAEAAKEIKELIQDSVEKVQQGTDLVDESGKTLEEIVSSVKKVTDIVSEIASSSQEQSAGIEQVNKAIMQMDDMTQQNAALVEEAAAASRSMEDESSGLLSLVSQFKTGNSSSMNRAQQSMQQTRQPASQENVAQLSEARSANKNNQPQPGSESVSPARTVPVSKTGTDDEWSEF